MCLLACCIYTASAGTCTVSRRLTDYRCTTVHCSLTCTRWHGSDSTPSRTYMYNVFALFTVLSRHFVRRHARTPPCTVYNTRDLASYIPPPPSNLHCCRSAANVRGGWWGYLLSQWCGGLRLRCGQAPAWQYDVMDTSSVAATELVMHVYHVCRRVCFCCSRWVLEWFKRLLWAVRWVTISVLWPVAV